MENQKGSIEKHGNNFGTWIAFIAVSLYLLLDIAQFNSLTIKYSISSVLGVLGALGLGTEIHSITGKKFSIDNITLGLVLIAIYICFQLF